MMDDATAIEKVLIHLAETRGQWQIRRFDQLLRRGEMCPLTSLEGSGLPVSEYNLAAERIGISKFIAYKVVDCADNQHDRRLYDPALRTAMLRAAGLES